MTETTLEFAGLEPLWVAVVTAFSLGATAFFYIRARRFLTPRRVALLAALRIVWLAVVLTMFVRPVLRTAHTAIEKLQLAVCIDTSASMGIRDYDNLPGRLSRALGYLTGDTPTAEKLGQYFDTRFIAFDATPMLLETAGELTALTADGGATDIASALRAATDGAAPGALRGVVLITDGIHNATAGAEAVAAAREAGTPVYAVGVGTQLQRDGSFTDVNILSARPVSESEVAVNHDFTVEVKLESWGLAQTIVPVELYEADAGESVQRSDVVLTSAATPQTATFTLKHAQEGRYLYTVRVPPQQGETILENNTATFTVNVTAPRIRVLYIDKARWESRFLTDTFLMDPGVEAVAFTEVSLGQVVQRGRIAGLEIDGIPSGMAGFRQFDAIVIGDIDSDNPLLRGRLAALAEAVEDGSGLVMLGGNNAFAAGGYGQTPLRDALPVAVGPRPSGEDDGQVREPFALTLTRDGQAHPIFTGYVDLLTAIGPDALPEMQGCVRVGPARPTATVLAVNPTETAGDAPMPVLAYQRHGRGMAVAFTADSTYQWHFKLRALGRESPYVKFWSQMLRFAARRDVSDGPIGPGVKVYTDDSVYLPGDTVALTAHVTGLEGQTPREPAVAIEITGPNGEPAGSLALGIDPAEPATLRGTFDTPQGRPGVYTALAIASDRGQEVGRQEARFIVAQPNKEFERLDLDRDLLDALARESGGAYYPLVDFDRLLGDLGASAESHVMRTEFAPWNRPAWLFAAFILLVTAEWALRKHWRLV